MATKTEQVYITAFDNGVTKMAIIGIEGETPDAYIVNDNHRWKHISGIYIGQVVWKRSENVFTNESSAWRWLYIKAQKYTQRCQTELLIAKAQERDMMERWHDEQ